jgi:hypothetical protein
MRHRMVTAVAVGALAFGALGAGPGENNGNGGGPGPFGPNNFGLCTAWAASENGRENGNAGNAPPFRALQDTAAEEGYDSVEDWCAEYGQQPGNGNGNPPGSR